MYLFYIYIHIYERKAGGSTFVYICIEVCMWMYRYILPPSTSMCERVFRSGEHISHKYLFFSQIYIVREQVGICIYTSHDDREMSIHSTSGT